MEYLLDLLFDRDPILRQTTHKRLTRAVLFYMYWNCDIGEVVDAPRRVSIPILIAQLSMLRFSYLLGCARSDFVNILRCSNTPAKLFWAETCFFCLRSSFLDPDGAG